MKTSIAAFGAVVALGAFAHVYDGMYFDLKCRGDVDGNGRLDLDEVVNAMAVGSSAGGASIYGNSNPNPSTHELIGFTEETEWRFFYNDPSPVRKAIRLPQSYYRDNENNCNCLYKDAVVFSVPAATAPCTEGRTMFVRFYWEGWPYPGNLVNESIIASDSWSYNGKAGYALSLSPYGDDMALQVWLADKNNKVKRNTSIAIISSNKWYDVAIRLDTNGEKTTARTCFGGGGNLDHWDGTDQFSVPLVADGAGRLVIGAENYDTSKYGVCILGKQGPKVFKGKIAELKIWNRSLSDAELEAVFRNETGVSAMAGVVNGSSDEFGADPVDVFDPWTMDWGRMRKELTAEHPSLFMKTAFRPEEEGLGKSFILTPVIGGATSCKVKFLVNGHSVVDTTLFDGVEKTIHIRKQDWKADADGNVSMELRRTDDLSGTLGIDALMFGGSWQLGKQDGNYDDFAYESGRDAFANYFIGDTNTLHHLRRATFEVGGSSLKTNIVLNFYCPASMKDLDSKFSVQLLNKANPTTTPVPFVFRVNGGLTFERSLAKWDSATMEIPAGTFRAGLNTISVEHHAEQANTWAGMDFYRLQFKCPGPGLVLVVK